MADKPFHPCSPLACIGLGLILVLCFQIGGRLGHAQIDQNNSPIAILVSKHIKPYMDAAAGLQQYLQAQDVPTQVFLLEDGDSLQPKRLTTQLQEHRYQAAVAIGPQATRFLWHIPDLHIPALFSMVLRPQQAVGDTCRKLCGVSLSLPVDIQLQTIEHLLPDPTRIGLLFHSDHNQIFYKQALKAADHLDMNVVPLRISDTGEISQVLAEHLAQIDVLWLIPDQVLNSKKVVEYIIKQALYAQVPVIGYNRFFHESGAAVSFVFDYAQIGRQTGRLLMRRLEEGVCNVQSAEFEVWENERIYQILGLKHE